MAGLSDILTAIQNGVVALNDLGKQVSGSFNNIASQLTALQAQSYKIIAFTRVLSTASGNQTVSGIGFKPRLVQFQTGITGGSTWMSMGQSNVATNTCQEWALNAGGTLGAFAQAFAGIQRDDAAGANFGSFVVASFDVDGFTLTWTKVGVPTATAQITGICFR